jgi:hypothetical protein
MSFALKSRKPLALVVFSGTGLIYFSMSPLSVAGMGYMPAHVAAAGALFHDIGHLLGLVPDFVPIRLFWHGILEPLIELPFYSVGSLFGPNGPDRAISFEPMLLAALICTVIFLWVRKITQSDRWALVLSLGAAFTTMIWPYAYIGMETTQAFFLMLSGYLCLGSERRSKWATAAFAVSASIAVSVKASGVFLLPAVAFLVWTYCRSQSGLAWPRFAAIAAVVLSVLAGNRYLGLTANAYGWIDEAWGGGPLALFRWSITTPFVALLNVWNLFFSMNKGLFVYCPILLFAVWKLGAAFGSDRKLCWFVGLAVAGSVIGIASTFYWADEVWGPRYLLAIVGPMVLLIAASRGQVAFEWRRQIGLAVLMLWGFAVSFLGVFIWYHPLHVVAMESEPLTIEQLQYDVEWNPIRFNAQLMRVWLEDSVLGLDVDQPWPSKGHYWVRENKLHEITPFNIRMFATPQPVLFKPWRGQVGIRLLCLISLVSGLALLVRARERTRRTEQPGPISAGFLSDPGRTTPDRTSENGGQPDTAPQAGDPDSAG